MNRLCYALIVWKLCTTCAMAGNWPAWRGPGGQGHTTETDLPLEWGPNKNIRWKIPLKEFGNSTPIIWENSIFLTEANRGGSKRGLICIDRTTGKERWRRDIEFAQTEKAWNPTFYASASAVTDGRHVVVSYGSAGMYCYDFSGKELWKRTDLGLWTHQFGNSASPIIYGDTAILWLGPDSKINKLLAVKLATGETVWETGEQSGSWSTPVVAKVDGKDQLLLGMSRFFKGYDPKTGKELWRCEGLNELCYTSALFSEKHGIAVAMSGYNKDALAVKLGGTGDITANRLWHHPRNTQRVGSGAIVGDYVYMLEESGVPHCYELKTGKEVWQVDQRPAGKTWSSMVVSGDRLYVVCQDASTVVFKAAPKFELLAHNKMGKGERSNSSLAVSDREIFLRTSQFLWCISQKK